MTNQYNKQRYRNNFISKEYCPEKHKAYVARTSKICRIIGLSLNIAFTINVIVVSLSNDADTPWGVADWALWMNSIVVGSIALSLLVTLMFLLATIKTYIKGA